MPNVVYEQLHNFFFFLVHQSASTTCIARAHKIGALQSGPQSWCAFNLAEPSRPHALISKCDIIIIIILWDSCSASTRDLGRLVLILCPLDSRRNKVIGILWKAEQQVKLAPCYPLCIFHYILSPFHKYFFFFTWWHAMQCELLADVCKSSLIFLCAFQHWTNLVGLWLGRFNTIMCVCL